MAGEESTLITQAHSAEPSSAAENGRLERKVWHESRHSGMKVKKAQTSLFTVKSSEQKTGIMPNVLWIVHLTNNMQHRFVT